MSFLLKNFNDIKDKIDFLCDKVKFYDNSDIAQVIYLKQPTKFNILGKEIVECEKRIEFCKGGEIETIFPVDGESYKGYGEYVCFFTDGSIEEGVCKSGYITYYLNKFSVECEDEATEEYNLDCNKKRYLFSLRGKLTIKREDGSYSNVFDELRFNSKKELIGYTLNGKYYDLER